jgi:maltoporin
VPRADEPGKQAAPPAAETGTAEAVKSADAKVAPDPVTAKEVVPKNDDEPKDPGPKVPEPKVPESGFFFGSYGRVVAATDFRKRPGRDADIVARGSRLDESPYFELDVQRQDYWKATNSTTRAVITLGTASPFFHYNGEFDIRMAVRNLFVEEHDLLVKGLSAWAGSRMYRGDDAYLLDFWPLDNLNTMGGGVRYDLPSGRTYVALHGGLNQPNTGFFRQTVQRTPSLNQPGASQVNVLDRQKLIMSLKASHVLPIGATAGIKGVLYGELHDVSSGQRENTRPGAFETLPGDSGYVIGAQIGAFTGKDASHVNLFIRYAGGLAAYGEFGSPYQLNTERTTAGAHDFRVTLSGNYEAGPLGVMLAGYARSYRNASPDLDFDDVNEGIIVARPHFFIGESAGIAAEVSYQAQQRGVLATPQTQPGGPVPPPAAGPHHASLVRFGLIPFLNPAGKGDYSRPQFRLIYLVTRRDDGARALYSRDDVFGLRTWEHFFGVGVEWWFNAQTTYGG